MENVKGLLSAKRREVHMFERILKDLENPARWARFACEDANLEYRLYSLVTHTQPDKKAPEDFVVHSEKYGIPQARHRVVILGIRSDFERCHRLIAPQTAITVAEAINDLPRLRSGV